MCLDVCATSNCSCSSFSHICILALFALFAGIMWRPSAGGDTAETAYLRSRIEALPGLGGTQAAGAIVACGIDSWEALGRTSWADWQSVNVAFGEWELLKRVEFPEDLRNETLLGPGHMNSLDELRKTARRDLQLAADRAQAAARAAARAAEREVGLSSEDAAAASNASDIADVGVLSDIDEGDEGLSDDAGYEHFEGFD